MDIKRTLERTMSEMEKLYISGATAALPAKVCTIGIFCLSLSG